MIIIVVVLNFTIMLITNQITSLIYVVGLSYVFTIFYAINASVAWLMYEGRRWRILFQAILFNTLTSLLIPSSTIVLGVAAILHAFTADLIFNSFYSQFKTKNRLFWWIILLQIFFWVTAPFFTFVFLASFVYPINSVLNIFLVPTLTVGLPIMIIEAILGAIIGYKIFQRVENIH